MCQDRSAMENKKEKKSLKRQIDYDINFALLFLTLELNQ